MIIKLKWKLNENKTFQQTKELLEFVCLSVTEVKAKRNILTEPEKMSVRKEERRNVASKMSIFYLLRKLAVRSSL